MNFYICIYLFKEGKKYKTKAKTIQEVFDLPGSTFFFKILPVEDCEIEN